MKKSAPLSLSHQVKTHLFFYLVTGVLSGLMLWIVEAIERSLALRHQLVQPGEASVFWLYFVFTAVGGPLWGLFLTACSGVRLSAFHLVSAEKPLVIGKYTLDGRWRQRLAAVVGLMVFFGVLSLLIPNYLSNPLYGMIAGATEKMKYVRMVLGHRKLSLLLLFGVLSVALVVIDELVEIFLHSKPLTVNSSKLKALSRLITPGLAGVGWFLFAVGYVADSHLMVTRRDLSFHVPMYFMTLAASLLLGGLCYRLVAQTIPGRVLLVVAVCSIGGTLWYTTSHLESNQNLKSLFWRRGVIAKRYIGWYRELTHRDQNDFSLVLSSVKTTQPLAQNQVPPSEPPPTNHPLNETLSSLLTPSFSLTDGVQVATRGNPVGPRNVIFLSIDTLRADHMGIYGYQRPTTPNLDRFARQSLFCERSYSTGTNTGHSFSSIFRSALGDGIFDPEIPTIAKVFSEHGYQTACITSPKTKTWLYKGRWFEYKKIMMDNFQEVTHNEPRTWPAKEMTDRSIELLKRLKDKGPFFAWVHYTDPHAPYEQHNECKYGTSDPDIYDSEITYTDIHIGRLLQFLEESGLMRSTMIVFTSDHGEGFNEHGAVEHGCLPYIEQNFIPIWVYSPEVTGQRLAMPVSHLDLSPTMLGFAHIAAPSGYEGVDLIRLSRGEVPPHPYVVTETPRNIPEATFFAWALTENDWKIIYDRVGSNWQLYNLKDDPTEQYNLADVTPKKFSELKQKLSVYLNQQASRKNYSQWRRFL